MILEVNDRLDKQTLDKQMGTMGIWISDKSGIWKDKNCLMAKWAGIWMPSEYRIKFIMVFSTPFEWWTSEYWTSERSIQIFIVLQCSPLTIKPKGSTVGNWKLDIWNLNDFGFPNFYCYFIIWKLYKIVRFSNCFINLGYAKVKKSYIKRSRLVDYLKTGQFCLVLECGIVHKPRLSRFRIRHLNNRLNITGHLNNGPFNDRTTLDHSNPD